MSLSATVIFSVSSWLLGALTDRPVDAETNYLSLRIDPRVGATIQSLRLVANDHEWAGNSGLLQDGFGSTSRFDPNRRLGRELDVTTDVNGNASITFRYACDGPNTHGLIVTRTVTPLRHESSIQVRWRVENQGDASHWVAPWVQSSVVPGGKIDSRDHFDVPTLNGIQRIRDSRIELAARNWIAVTDPEARESLYMVFDAEEIHAFQTIVGARRSTMAVKAFFVPRVMAPGDVWETVYRLNMVRGLERIDFATDELAAELTTDDDETLKLLISPTRPMETMEFQATVTAPKRVAESLPAKRFSLVPNRLVQCTYPWSPKGPGPFAFQGRLRREDGNVSLGGNTNPPFDGIETTFASADSGRWILTPWTAAPFALEREGRRLERTLAYDGDVKAWFESSLEKIFPDDVPIAAGAPVSTHELFLARNERESFQVILRSPDGDAVRVERVVVGKLVDRRNKTSLAAHHVSAYRVGFVPVDVPSHYENPTGLYPDPLIPFTPFTAPMGFSTPFWFTVYAPLTTAPGRYEGPLELVLESGETVKLTLRVTVFDFALPSTPAFRTDFGYSHRRAASWAEMLGTEVSPSELDEAYLTNASDHRVTLRSLTQFPNWSPDYKAELEEFENRLPIILDSAPSSILIPASLTDEPESLGYVNDVVARHGLEELAFVPIEGATPEAIVARIDQWKELAPEVPRMVSLAGRGWAFPDAVNVLDAHVREVDNAGVSALSTVKSRGTKLWWHIDDEPGRPYANFFTDLSGLDHRILFWQAWLYGVEGLRYAGVNAYPSGKNPFEGSMSATPTNGGGTLVYPGANGPVNSIRWEIIRDGIEDFDYLVMLRERLARLSQSGSHTILREQAETLLNVAAITSSLSVYSENAQKISDHRKRIARLIEAIDGTLGQ